MSDLPVVTHSHPDIIVSVPKYEQVTDVSGNIITYYIIKVEIIPFKLKYTLKKRYSDFDKLRNVLLDEFENIDSELVQLEPTFRFPNKSIFSTNAEFTIIRRQQGFDDYLNLLLTHFIQIPKELDQFLELTVSKHKIFASPLSLRSAQKSRRLKSATSFVEDTVTSINSSVCRKPSLTNLHFKKQVINNFVISTWKEKTFSKQSREFSNKQLFFDKDTIQKIGSIFRPTYISVLIVYIISVYFGFISVKDVKLYKMAVTVFSLGTLVLSLQIIMFRSQKNKVMINNKLNVLT